MIGGAADHGKTIQSSVCFHTKSGSTSVRDLAYRTALRTSAPKPRSSFITNPRVREISKLLNLVPAAAQAVKCPDETDGWILADAVEAKCDYFITGDRVVLALYSVQGMRIITPREMMDYLYTGKPIPKFEAHQDRAKYLVQRLEKIY